METAFLTGGVSLVGQEVAGPDTGPAIIDGEGGSAVFVGLVASAGTINGLTLRGDGFALFAQGSLGQITQNTFDDPSADSAGIALSGPSTLINANTFVGDGVSNETAIDLRDGAAMVSDNTISGHHAAIFVTGSGPGTTSTPTIAGNTITGSHQVGGTAGSGVASFGSANPTIAGNRVSGPGAGASIAISVNGFSVPAATGATLRRNTVSGAFVTGISIKDNGLAVTMNSDLVTGAAQGFDFQDQGPADPLVGDVTATNVTAWGNTQDITTIQNALTLDSSIVEDPISATAATCAIGFSRGPTTTPGGNGCLNFQTTAAPGFVNAGAGDFHLLSGSSMIDMGNTAAPGVTANIRA